jgi:hypothetical protein
MITRSRALGPVVLALGILPLAADVPAPPDVPYENVPYNGKFTFARLRFTPSSWGPGGYMWNLDLKWNHDYPRAESHFMKILAETTTIEPNEQGNILALDDPELFKYPVAYICEVGYWTLTDKEAAGLRAWLLKGGFLIVDDFSGRDWINFSSEMARVLPEARLVELTASHPVFDSFFRLETLPGGGSFRRRFAATYHGIFEDNDPARRLMVVANYNNDIGEFWEWSDTGFVPIDLSNEAYKLGVNYVVYGMTH